SDRHRTVHQILGGGFAADVILWKKKDVTLNILTFASASWFIFQLSGYTLLTFLSSVLFLLFTILFIWAKSSALLNRPSPSIPRLHLSEEATNRVAGFVRNHLNDALFLSEEIALGRRDSAVFLRLAVGLLVISLVGALADFFTLCYSCLTIVLTVPAIYDRYEDRIDALAVNGYEKLMQFYATY
ncbi:hypothetical protein M569_14838, partial [Genlisea aurea]